MAKSAAVVMVVTALVSASAWGQGQLPYPRLPAPPVKSPPDTTAPNIVGVVRGGTKVQLIRDMFRSTEGPIAMLDGSLLFTEQDAGDGQLVRIDKDDRVAVLYPTRTILADEFEGIPLVAPNDLVADKKGGIYFTDPLNSRFRPTPVGRTKPLLLYVRPDGTRIKVSDEVERPNGITLSPDESVLYAANGSTIAAFDVQSDGTLRNFRTFAKLAGGNADSMCIDGAGRLYVAADGVQVFSPQGQLLGTIPTPLRPQATAFAGPDKKTLYVVGSGAVWKIAMLAQGVLGRAK